MINPKNFLHDEAEAVDLILPLVPGFMPTVKYKQFNLTQKMPQVPDTETRSVRLVRFSRARQVP